MPAAQKTSKKRPAPTQSGPTPKKLHLEKPAKGKEAAPKKRSQPVTKPVRTEDSASDDQEFDDLEAAENDMDLDDGVGGDQMHVDSFNAPAKDPNGMFPIAIPVLYNGMDWMPLGEHFLLVSFISRQHNIRSRLPSSRFSVRTGY